MRNTSKYVFMAQKKAVAIKFDTEIKLLGSPLYPNRQFLPQNQELGLYGCGMCFVMPGLDRTTRRPSTGTWVALFLVVINV